MALSATLVVEIETGGADYNATTPNGGGFDPGQSANASTTGTLGSANTASPTLSDSTYIWSTPDIGNWVFFPVAGSITATYSGWYQVASVAGGVATLTAGIGTAVNRSTMEPTTVIGCYSSASLSTATWMMDYSQQGSPNTTGLVYNGTTSTVTVALLAAGYQNWVGNLVFITSTGGATSGYYMVVSTTSASLTFDRSPGTVVNGTLNMGGAVATSGGAGNMGAVGGTYFAMKAGSYTQTSATANAAAGAITLPAGTTAAYTRMVGYQTLRGDYGTKPVITASGITAFNMIFAAGAATIIDNISLNGGNPTPLATGKGFNVSTSGGCQCLRCSAANFTNTAFAGNGSSTTFEDCQATGCTVSPAFLQGNCLNCVAIANAIEGFQHSGQATLKGCISANNTGSGGHGYNVVGATVNYLNCNAYGNAQDGFHSQSPSTSGIVTYENCISENNTVDGFNCATAWDGIRLFNCATEGNGTLAVGTTISPSNIFGLIQYTGSAFVAAGSKNFALNNTSGAGALLRAAGYVGVFPSDVTTTAYPDIGAAQSQASGGGSSTTNFGIVIGNGAPMIGDW
jgi:hypothetical protein